MYGVEQVHFGGQLPSPPILSNATPSAVLEGWAQTGALVPGENGLADLGVMSAVQDSATGSSPFAPQFGPLHPSIPTPWHAAAMGHWRLGQARDKPSLLRNDSGAVAKAIAIRLVMTLTEKNRPK